MKEIEEPAGAPQSAPARPDSELLLRDLVDALSLVGLGAPAAPSAARDAPAAAEPGPAEPDGTGDFGCADASSSDAIAQFCLDRELLARLRVTPEELGALSQASLLGSVSCKADVLFMLRTIRRCMASGTAAGADAIYREMAEDMRRNALERLEQLDSSADTRRCRRWRLAVPAAGSFAIAAALLYQIRSAPLGASAAGGWLRPMIIGSLLMTAALALYVGRDAPMAACGGAGSGRER